MLRQWKISWNIELNGDSPVYKQIENAIITEISKGRFAAGTPMPGSRELARHLKLNRNTVAKAYEQLISTGWLQAEGKRGTFVATQLPVPNPMNGNSQQKQKMPDAGFSFNTLSLDRLIETGEENAWDIRFDDGFPDPHLAPIHELNSTYKRIFRWKMRQNKIKAPYPTVSESMQELFCQFLNQNRGFCLDTENVSFIMGQQIALYMVAQVLLKKGDTVVMGNPGNALACHIFNSCHAGVLPCDTDQEGISTDQLELICKQQKIKAVYLSPQCGYPTTVTLSQDRRDQLLRLAQRYNFAVIEADHDHEYWFGEHPFIPLAAQCGDANVIYISSASKMLPPFFLIGIVAGPADFMRSLKALQNMIGQQGDIVMENTVQEMMSEGTIPKYARKSLNYYKVKRDKVALILRNYLHPASFEKPQGGLAYWLNFNEGTDVPALLRRLKQRRIFIPDPNSYLYTGKPVPAIRLGYGSLELRELENGVKAIAELLQG